MTRPRAPGNRTLSLSPDERDHYRQQVLQAADLPADGRRLQPASLANRVLRADLASLLDRLPPACADLIFLDPPYNLDKDFHGQRFAQASDAAYLAYLESWLPGVLACLKPGGSVYLCGDWQNSACLYQALKDRVRIRNRITWQREKGRGAKANWKNITEDIWFGTLGNDYYFDVDAVKQKRRVIAPYRDQGQPKDWETSDDGRFRLTHPGNFWDDLSVPYWSMPENTDHPTQKPEKLLAKLILASCPPGGLVLDPFLGSGTTAVVARKLGRNFIGIEQQEEYCLWACKRLDRARTEPGIQGYADGVFWERNTHSQQLSAKRRQPPAAPASPEQHANPAGPESPTPDRPLLSALPTPTPPAAPPQQSPQNLLQWELPMPD